MTLNGSLAGLVAITAGCDVVTPMGAFFIGLIAAVVGVFGIVFVEKVRKVDDPVGAIGVHGLCGATCMTVTQVLGYGVQRGHHSYYRGVRLDDVRLLPKVKVEVIVSKVPVQTVIDAARQALYTGHVGDGKIFVYDVKDTIRVRTGEQGYDALQGD